MYGKIYENGKTGKSVFNVLRQSLLMKLAGICSPPNVYETETLLCHFTRIFLQLLNVLFVF